MSRLVDKATLMNLQSFAGFHLGEQHHASIDIEIALSCSESNRLQLLPHIFGLMPVDATFRKSPYIEVKPIIAQHLEGLGVEPTSTLVAIIKDLCDNFDRTRFRDGPPALRPRKQSIGDLRQQPTLYKLIRERQGRRCGVCGTEFSAGPREETLDHVIPWRLGGDPPGGWNWQLLCRRCNNAKDTLIAAYATPEYFNWIFPDPIGRHDAQGIDINERGRYLALRHFGHCQVERCGRGPSDDELRVARRCRTGFSVLDHLSVVCTRHSNEFGALVG